MRYSVKCPKCGAEQTGLDLKESMGWVVCYECDTKFKADEVALQEQNTDKKVKKSNE